MSLIEVKVFVVCGFGLFFLAYVLLLLIFRFMAHGGAAHGLRGVFRVYHRRTLGLAIANGGTGCPVVNNVPEATRRKSGILQVLLVVAARLPIIRSER